jgi:hypothetical protein
MARVHSWTVDDCDPAARALTARTPPPTPRDTVQVRAGPLWYVRDVRIARAGLLVCVVGCGRVAFDEVAEPGANPALGPLACGASRVISDLPAVPLGLGLVSTGTGAIVVWSGGIAGTTLQGARLAIAAHEIVDSQPLSIELPRAVAELGLVGDGDTRYLVSGAVGGIATFVVLDSTLTAGPPVRLAAAITGHAVAEPIVGGSAMVAAWTDASATRFSQLDATGAPIGAGFTQPAGREVSIRRVAQLHIAVWAASGGGCQVWALDAGFVPVVPEPVTHLPGGSCLRPAITRHAGQATNLLAWITDGDARGQLGTDTQFVGGELDLAAGADDLDIATAPSGFFVTVAASDTLITGYLHVDGRGATGFAKRPHVPGSPVRVVAHGAGALVASIDSPAGVAQLVVTRLCEP